jgi:hypothetical protein
MLVNVTLRTTQNVTITRSRSTPCSMNFDFGEDDETRRFGSGF